MLFTERPAQTLTLEDGATIAYRKLDGISPGIVFFGGFMSDMQGTKARMLEEYCSESGRAYVRFDYQGHGESSGDFTDGTIGSWAQDAIAVLDHCTDGPQVLVGSSMGGWIMLLAALARPERISAMLGIAAAPDFTEDLLWEGMDESERRQLREEGICHQPAEQGSEEQHPITMELIEEGRHHLLLRNAIPLACPVRLMHGMRDTVVPCSLPGRIMDKLVSEDVNVILIKDGDHRLSREQDLAQIRRLLGELFHRAGEDYIPAIESSPSR